MEQDLINFLKEKVNSLEKELSYYKNLKTISNLQENIPKSKNLFNIKQVNEIFWSFKEKNYTSEDIQEDIQESVEKPLHEKIENLLNKSELVENVENNSLNDEELEFLVSSHIIFKAITETNTLKSYEEIYDFINRLTFSDEYLSQKEEIINILSSKFKDNKIQEDTEEIKTKKQKKFYDQDNPHILLTDEMLLHVPKETKHYEKKDLENMVVHAAYFVPFANNWTWYLTRYNPITQVAYGLVLGDEAKFGYFSIKELEQVHAQRLILRTFPKTFKELRLEGEFENQMYPEEQYSIFGWEDTQFEDENYISANVQKNVKKDIKDTKSLLHEKIENLLNKSKLIIDIQNNYKNDKEFELTIKTQNEIFKDLTETNTLKSYEEIYNFINTFEFPHGNIQEKEEVLNLLSAEFEIKKETKETQEIKETKEKNGILNKIKNFVSQEKEKVLDYHKNDDFTYGNTKERFENNIKALTLSNKLKLEKKLPNKEEQEILASFSGFGGLNSYLENDENIQMIKNIISPNQDDEIIQVDVNKYINQLRLSSFNAYYTPKLIIDAIYHGLDRLGLNQDENVKEILEPSCGSGNFLTFNTHDNYNFTAVEIDKETSKITSLLHPNAKIINSPLEKVKFIKNFDAIIGNPPYGNEFRVLDNLSSGNGATLHNYFNIKALELAKEYGIVAFVTSSYFLDAKTSKYREQIASMGNFLGAFRLPNNLFSNTNVTTDIIFVQKGNKNENIHHDDFINVKGLPANDDVKINEYFINNPRNVLGSLQITTNQFGQNVITCKNTFKNNQELFEELIERINVILPKNIYQYTKTNFLETTNFQIQDLKNQRNLKIGNLVLHDNAIYRIFNKEFDHEVDVIFVMDKTHENYEKFEKLIIMQDELKQLYNLETSTDDEKSIENQRSKVNNLYDDFVKKYKFLHNTRTSTKEYFDMKNPHVDVEANLILNLEKEVLKDNKITYEKADILSHRIFNKKQNLIINNAKDAYLITLSKKGRFDIEYFEVITKDKYKEYLQDLLEQKLIYKDHEREFDFVENFTYLSGNVKKKYNEVLANIQNGKEGLENNLEDLKNAFPPYIQASDININLGSTIVDKDIYIDFMREKIFQNQCDNDLLNSNLVFMSNVKGWVIALKLHHGVQMEELVAEHPFNIYSYQNRKNNKDILDLLEYAFNNKTPQITKSKKDDKEIDYEMTMLVNEKIAEIKEMFNEWIFEDYDRRTRIEEKYNNTINVFAQTKYDGNLIKYDELNKDISLTPLGRNPTSL